MPRITWMTYLRISFDQIPKHYLLLADANNSHNPSVLSSMVSSE